MAKFKQGQTVWGARFFCGELRVASGVVTGGGEARVRVSSGGTEAAFGFRTSIPTDEVFASEIEALEALTEDVWKERAAAESAVVRADANRKTVAAAIARLAGVTS